LLLSVYTKDINQTIEQNDFSKRLFNTIEQNGFVVRFKKSLWLLSS